MRERLLQARRGKGILFCGAGFTADCLNFDEDEALGVTPQLLRILNETLLAAGEPGRYRNVQNAADKVMAVKGEHGLMNQLKQRFTLQHVSQDMTEILRFPWERVYTTNFDNGIELALKAARRQANCVNNVEEIGALERPGVPVIHLHGAAERWDIHNFRRSCVLGADSYMRAGGGSEMPELDAWLAQLQRDLSRAEGVVFVGFSSQDFHLNRVFRSASDLQGRSFFVNRPTSDPDPDETATQERYGRVCAIGRAGLTQMVEAVLAEDLPTEPSLASFVRFEPPQAAAEILSVPMIERLLIWGEENEAQIARDILSGRSDYHLLRAIQPALREAMAAGVSVYF